MSETAAIPVGLQGHLRLVCTANPVRGTYVSAQSFAVPMHLSKTYWDDETLLVNVVNQTAGIFGGDSITTHVVVEQGAHVLLSGPSASRFHPSEGREARLEQTFEIASGASLEFFPEISIPQRHSRSTQITRIEIQPGGELLYLETLAPGRVASGEIFAFEHYRWATDIRWGGRLIHRERACIRPGDPSSASLRALHPASYYAGFILVSPASESWGRDFSDTVSGLTENPSITIAASKLSAGGWSIRILTADSLGLREAIKKVRSLVYLRLGRRAPDVRRAGA